MGEGSGDDDSERGRRDDPFDQLDTDDYRDRSGNPFEDFEGTRPDDDASDWSDESSHEDGSRSERSARDGADRSGWPDRSDDDRTADSGGDDPFTYPEGREDAPGGPDRPGDPFAAGTAEDGQDRDSDPSEGRSTTPFDDVQGRGDPFESGSSAFERVSTEGIDPDAAWDSLTDAEDGGSVVETDDGTVEVSKHAYCEGCEHFSGPPDIHCTHEGTRILEFTDMEQVKVVNCPVVAEQRELGRDGGPDESV